RTADGVPGGAGGDPARPAPLSPDLDVIPSAPLADLVSMVDPVVRGEVEVRADQAASGTGALAGTGSGPGGLRTGGMLVAAGLAFLLLRWAMPRRRSLE
ncbi:MAG: hypothetical protein ACRDY7_08600, partial [Acidimicrobiia bacterium]